MGFLVELSRECKGSVLMEVMGYDGRMLGCRLMMRVMSNVEWRRGEAWLKS